MAVTALTLTNPGAESAAMTGWTVAYGGTWSTPTVDGAINPNAGSRFFMATPGPIVNSLVYQDVAVPGGLTASVDAGTCAAQGTMYAQVANTSQWLRMWIEFYDVSSNLLAQYIGKYYAPTGAWTLIKEGRMIPAGTRTIRLIWNTHPNLDAGGALSPSNLGAKAYFDDFTLSISTAPNTDWPETAKALQMGVYALGTFPAAEARAETIGELVVGQAETVNTLFDVFAHQYGVLALVRGAADRRELRAWTFKQDDHEFYVLHLNNYHTIIYDKLTGQWADWVSPNYTHWRGGDGCNWAGIAVACDTLTGKLWQIDPSGRLDYGTTPIRSVIKGGMTERFRQNFPVYMAELAVSQAKPAAADGSVGVTLRTGDGNGNWYDHGQIVGDTTGTNVNLRWYGLGLTAAPGAVFEITDTGYARRIDGLNIEVPDRGGEA